MNSVKLLPVDLTPQDQIQEQIDLRVILMSEMVGHLYPGIIRDEIIRLRKMDKTSVYYEAME